VARSTRGPTWYSGKAKFLVTCLPPPSLQLPVSSLSSMAEEHSSILEQLDAAVPLARFDAFPKLPSSYKARSESRGFFTLFTALIAILLILNDVGEYIWGWPDYEFSIDTQGQTSLNVNVDMVVNMPCQCKSFQSLCYGVSESDTRYRSQCRFA
jgi:hypothetical protein